MAHERCHGFFYFRFGSCGCWAAYFVLLALRLIRDSASDAASAAAAANVSAQAARTQANVAEGTLRTIQNTAQQQLRLTFMLRRPIFAWNIKPGRFL
jgi:hypothetical protein